MIQLLLMIQELAKTLQRVLTDVKSQQSVSSQELSIVYRLRESEVNMLEEKLNGALCDDMGLGKTLQVLILIEN